VSTGLIVAIVIVALILIALLFLLPRMRSAARQKQAQRELHSRRSHCGRCSKGSLISMCRRPPWATSLSPWTWE
jgi:predicted RND superfamily exporter protein